jgi:Dolichyl-phosphate-mannose-protein mannosyltransferase
VERRLVLGAGLALFGAAAALARYGLDPSDEGYIVYSAVEVAAGRVPYRDLNSLYTPLSWYVHAALFKLVGVDLVALRVWFGLVVAGLAVGVYLHARQLMSPELAVLPVLAFVLLFPVPGNWAPYPGWYALGGLLISLLALGRWCDDRRRRWLVLTGAGCAVAFACKSNLGLLGLLACCGFLLLQAHGVFGVAGRGVVRYAQLAFVAVCALALFLVIGGVATPGNVVLLVAPVLIAGALLVFSAAPKPSGGRFGDLVTAVRLIGLSFLVCTLPWYLALSAAAGWQLTFDSVFLAGARTAWAFYEPVVTPNRDALEAIALIVGGLALLGVLGRLARAGRLPARVFGFLAFLALLVLGAVLVWRSPAYVADNLWARWVRTATAPGDLPRFLPFLAEAGGIGLVAWRRSRRAPEILRLNLLVWFCVLFAFQLYPHASYLHILFSWAPFLVLLTAVAAEVWHATEPHLPSRGWRWAAYPLLAILPILLIPNAWRSRATVVEQTVALGLPRAQVVHAKTDDAARLRMVQARTASLQADAPLFAYPEVAMVYVLTGHPNPTRENYLATGYVDEAGQRAIIARLEESQTRYVVWDREGARRLESNAWYVTLTDYLRRAYAPVAEQDDWLLMERQSVPPNAGTPSSGGRRRRSPPRSRG